MDLFKILHLHAPSKLIHRSQQMLSTSRLTS